MSCCPGWSGSREGLALVAERVIHSDEAEPSGPPQRPALEQLIGDGAQQQGGADDRVLQFIADFAKTAQLTQERKHSRAEEHAGDGPLAAAQTATAEDSAGDGVQF